MVREGDTAKRIIDIKRQLSAGFCDTWSRLIVHTINDDRLMSLLLDSFLIGLGLGMPACLVSSFREAVFCGGLEESLWIHKSACSSNNE